MKTAILQCLQQFSSKISKNVYYYDQILKNLKLVPLQNLQNVRFSL